MKNLAAITAKRSAAKRKSKLSPFKVRELIRLIRVHDWSYSKVGRHLGVSPRSVKWRWLKHVIAENGSEGAQAMLDRMRAKPRSK